MATIGCLGDIPFQVSSEVVQTIKNAKWSGSAKYGTHQRHGGDTLTEFVGNDSEKFSFEMVLSAFLGVNPMELINKIVSYKREGRTLPLVIGETAVGRYRWAITNFDVKMQNTDGSGNLVFATVSVSLQEYLRS